MSKIIATAAIRGAHRYVEEAEEKLKLAIESKGESAKVSYPNTAYNLPIILSFLGMKVETLVHLKEALQYARKLLPPPPTQNLWLPYLGNTLDAGIATLIAEETIEALKFLMGPDPVDGIWLGFTDDSILRLQGIKLVDGRMPGFAACVGACPTNEDAVRLARELQEKNILVFLSSSSNGKSMAEQLAEEGVEMSWDTFLVPYGKDTSATVHALNFAVRAAMTFGGIPVGGLKGAQNILLYNKKRVHAFVLALGEDSGAPDVIADEKYATAAGAINFGFPVISNVGIPEIRPTGICTYEHVVAKIPLDKIVNKAIEVRGLKLKLTKIPIPVPFGAGFEGERVRKNDMYVQFGGKYTLGFELVRMRDLSEVEDGKIEVIGPDIDAIKPGRAMSLGFIVEVAGRKMQRDFETVLERYIHHFLSCAHGVMHIGQRDLIWHRISKEAFEKGFRLRHFAEIVRAKFLEEFSSIVDKVQVTICTDKEKAEEMHKEAKKVYAERDERMSKMSDEDVDIFYSCRLCQSYAPNHVCIITPERLGLCGAYTWLDGKASYEVNPHGGNEPVQKGKTIDATKGQWKGINEYVHAKSNNAIERFNAYSIMEEPETSCCISDTEVIVDGEVAKIGEFINSHQPRKEYSKSSVLTLSSGKTMPERIVDIQKFSAPKNLIRLTTKSGAEIILTEDHKVAIDRPDGLNWVRADQILPGDRAISIKRLELPSRVPDVIDLIPDDFQIRDDVLTTLMKSKLKTKYGSLSLAWRKLGLGSYHPRLKGLSFESLKLIVQDLGKNWTDVKKRIRKVARTASVTDLPKTLSPELFYLAGLITSDGSISRFGRYEYWIDFINTNDELISVYKNTYKQIFPNKPISVRRKGKTNAKIEGRRINSTKACYLCHTNNPVLGVILNHYGIKIGVKGKWNLSRLLSLPQNFIAAYLAGVFDGDGSVRLRKYQGRWDVGEAYLCIEEKRAASHLQLLLKRLGIVGNLRKSGSVYKIELYGTNLRRFAEQITVKHPKKRYTLEDIRVLLSDNKISKDQDQVLPFSFGKTIAELPESREILSPTTRSYYETARSRPIMTNVTKVVERLPKQRQDLFKSLMENDYLLDTVNKVERIQNKNRFKYVYNLTVADEYCYFANGLLIKNCGCFECIVGVIPETNGVMVVNRGFNEMTPIGMTFSTLANTVGGGKQIPGFIGVGKFFLTSKKFISADGGIKRLVWMPKELKEALGEKLKKRCEEEGVPELVDKIADETVATTSEELLAHLQKVNHPALSMPPLM